MLSLLLARAGVPVTLLEAHRDFERDFRGDTIHPATLEVLAQIGLAERLHQLPHVKAANATQEKGELAMLSVDLAQTRVPADLPADCTEELRHLAVECYRAVECEGMARVDFFLEEESGKLYINEINTIPGFTSISMYPKMWEHSGIGFADLLDRLIALALDRDKLKKATRCTR